MTSTGHTANKGITGFKHRPLPPESSIKHCARFLLRMTESGYSKKELAKKRSPNQLSESFFTSIFSLLLYFSLSFFTKAVFIHHFLGMCFILGTVLSFIFVSLIDP